ncbi:MAG: cobaltochelatase subunit CobN, partial [Oscillospiraceae bacterium]|jgi:cobaltochelatase CobN
MPHFYLYYVGNPSEAVIAKRRSHAAIISYQPPVFVPGELYGEYSELSAMIDEYHHQLSFSKSAANDVLDNIFKKAKECNLPEDLEELEKELYRMNRSLIPKGLHCYGENYSPEEARQYVKCFLRNTTGDYKSLRSLIAETRGVSIDELEDKGDYNAVSAIDLEADTVFDSYFSGKKIPDKISSDALKKTLLYGERLYKSVQENNEISNLLNVLENGYIPAKTAGDIYRSPDILPSGYNLIQFDQRLVPTLTAVQRGAKIAENTISIYYEKNGCYPNSTAVILWGLETSRTQGETYGQIMGYLGVKLAKGNSPWNAKYELVPKEELNRPRIDITINICGFFRDLFPNLIDNLDDIFHLVYAADENENENYFKANSNKLYDYLINKGYDEDEAKQLCVTRIFGPREGEYGTGITSIIETKAWEKEEQIGSQFLSSLHYAYNRRLHGADTDKLYEQNLKSVEVVSQVRDNNEYEITDLDHYYEFFGGLAKSVEMVSGKKAEMLITDTTGSRPLTENVGKSIDRGIRTRVLNPKWIDGMLSHKYHGAQKIAQRFENVMGLSATTGSVEQWVYNDLCAVYAEDEKMRNRMKENNPYAYMDILEQMTEYSRRGYWNATQEQLDAIKNAYLEIEEQIEDEI